MIGSVKAIRSDFLVKMPQDATKIKRTIFRVWVWSDSTNGGGNEE